MRLVSPTGTVLACLLISPSSSLFSSFFSSPASKEQEWPNPTKDFAACGRTTPGFVCDPDRLLTNLDDALDKLRGTRYKHLGNHSIELGVYLTKGRISGEDEDEDEKQAAAKKLAESLHELWGVGGEKQNGGVLLISVEDRVTHLSTGEGLRAVLSDDRVSRILEAIKPELRAAEYGAAARRVVTMIDKHAHAGPPLNTDVIFFVIYMCILIFIICMIIEAHRSSSSTSAALLSSGTTARRPAVSEFETARSQLERLDKLRQRATFAEFVVPDSCPICLEAFEMRTEGEIELPKAGSDEKPVSILACGHCFDQTCLAKWHGTTCPICRGPRDEQGSAALGGSSTRFDVEVAFRLAQLAVRHPLFITTNQGEEAVIPAAYLLAEDPAFLARRPSSPVPRAAPSTVVSRRSFTGGGKASGGAGASW